MSNKNRKFSKFLLIAAGILLVIQLPWYFTVQSYINKKYSKTAATIVSIDFSGSCTNFGSRQPYKACNAPTYEYKDTLGNTHKFTDRYGTSFTDNGLFKKQVGDKVTAYYPNGQPDSPFFRNGIFANTAWLAPLYLSVILLLIYTVIVIMRHIRLYLRAEI